MKNLVYIALTATSFIAQSKITTHVEPNSYDPIVPSDGGVVYYSENISNPDSQTSEVNYYSYLTFPDGSIYNFSMGDVLTLDPGSEFNENINHIKIPGYFPNGEYKFNYSALNRKSGLIASSSFSIIKGQKTSSFSSCAKLLESGEHSGDGIYTLAVNGEQLTTWCDMTNGGWTLVMRGYGQNRTGEWINVKSGALNVSADKSPMMKETFKFSDKNLNTIASSGNNTLKIMADDGLAPRFATGPYCHGTANTCGFYKGTYADEALTQDYVKGVNGSRYENIRGGISSDRTDSDSTQVFLYSYSSYANRAWALGGNIRSSWCTGLTASCNFSIWAK
ncbi:hypothetical protein MHM89_16330 [Pseudoalteromonas sp. CNC9-20]|uniref:fibrinogen-like YCDxxxxGGGW domain-containing protein n=1 Tax=Pseudoalteromonas TaxID=53246 RepID=UPI001EF61802|nr:MULTISPECIES: fibrinogen-like YCDxxxxGGGW domain-containing protein [Pseudoalteromonas]MCG7571471.1 hypothetical protein [Pseudoalteromonas sp. CNC9-20]